MPGAPTVRLSESSTAVFIRGSACRMWKSGVPARESPERPRPDAMERRTFSSGSSRASSKSAMRLSGSTTSGVASSASAAAVSVRTETSR